MEDNKLTATIVKCVATTICIFFLSVSGCTANRHYQTRVLVESGKADGVQAKCALDSDASGTCLNAAIRDMVIGVAKR